jgi:hypothetical protein
MRIRWEYPEKETGGDRFDGAEQRALPRLAVHDLSDIVLNGRGEAVSCVIENLSESGAKLHLSDPDLPPRFIIANYARKTRILCQRVWQKDRHVGVRFLKPPREFDFHKIAP